jgi:perosamine synthetase
MYGILVEDDFGMDMPRLRQELEKAGIETRTFFVGMHRQPAYHGKDRPFPDCTGAFPNAEVLERKGLYLPSSSHLTPEQINYIVAAIHKIHHAR